MCTIQLLKENPPEMKMAPKAIEEWTNIKSTQIDVRKELKERNRYVVTNNKTGVEKEAQLN